MVFLQRGLVQWTGNGDVREVFSLTEGLVMLQKWPV